MKKLATTILASLALVALASAAFAAGSPNVRISQVYGGGGGASGTYIYDYVELFNNSGSPVNIGGWSLQYGSATGTSFGSSAVNVFAFPANTIIQPCKYLLVQTSSAGTGGVALPVAADLVTTNLNMSGTAGKVALINNSTGNNPCTGNTVNGIFVDVVGYGTANCFETAAAPGTNSTQGVVRNGAGTVDTNSNTADFALVSAPVPHNSASAVNASCLSVPAMNSTWGQLKSLYR